MKHRITGLWVSMLVITWIVMNACSSDFMSGIQIDGDASEQEIEEAPSELGWLVMTGGSSEGDNALEIIFTPVNADQAAVRWKSVRLSIRHASLPQPPKCSLMEAEILSTRTGSFEMSILEAVNTALKLDVPMDRDVCSLDFALVDSGMAFTATGNLPDGRGIVVETSLDNWLGFNPVEDRFRWKAEVPERWLAVLDLSAMLPADLFTGETSTRARPPAELSLMLHIDDEHPRIQEVIDRIHTAFQLVVDLNGNGVADADELSEGNRVGRGASPDSAIDGDGDMADGDATEGDVDPEPESEPDLDGDVEVPVVDGDTSDGDLETDEDFENPPENPCLNDVLCVAQHRACINNGGLAKCGGCLPGYIDEVDTCVPNNTCERITGASVFTVNIETVNFRAIATKGGSSFVDPYAKSDIHLRDNSTGNMFKIYVDFADGGALEPVEVIKGSYDIWVENRFGQKKEAVKNVVIDQDTQVEAPFPFNRMTITLAKNGASFPTLGADHRGRLKLYDNSALSTFDIGEIGGGVNTYNVDVFESTYDIIFDGYLTDDDNAYQLDTLVSKDKVDSDRQYNLDIETVSVSGTLDLGGEPPESENGGFGEAWLINATNEKRFPFWPLDGADPLAFNREIIADAYYLCYSPPDSDGDTYLWRSGDDVVWNSSAAGEELELPLVHFEGRVRHKGGPMYELHDPVDDVYMDRGKVYLKNVDTGERLLLTELGSQGEVNFDVWVGPGTYAYDFEGRLINDNYYTSASYPPSIHQVIFETDVQLNQDTVADVELPVEELTGNVAVTLAGSPVTDFSEASGDYITVRGSSASSDIPIFRFHRLTGDHVYSTYLFPGVYDMRYIGENLFGVFQNNLVAAGFSVSAASTTFDIDMETRELGVTLTTESGTRTIYDLIQDGVFDDADIRVSNETTRLKAADEVDENGRFVIHRPVGELALSVYLYKGNSYQVYPLQDGYAFDNNEELFFNIEFLTFDVQVTKNGDQMPDAPDGNLYSRGNLFFKPAADWRVDIRYDLGISGEAYGTHTIHPGEYDIYFVVGYGYPLPFLQYHYIGCARAVE